MQLQRLIDMALAAGFTHAAPLDVSTLKPIPAVRDACVTNKCGKYGACWTCPPGCGGLDACAARMRRYANGLIVQTVGTLEDSLDIEGMQETVQKHKDNFSALADTLRGTLPDLLALGSGGCSICQTCAYPDAPCRFPDRAFSSMEANGLLVTDVCRDNGLSYYYGPNTIAYTSCFLWNDESER